jgi:hypothetical protein
MDRGYDTAIEAEQDTERRQEVYSKLTKRKIILVQKELLEKYPFRTTKLERIYGIDPNARFNIETAYGLTDRYFGGNIAKAAPVLNSPYVLLANSDDITIGILIPEQNLHLLTVEQLKDLCNLYKLEVPKDYKKQEIIELLINF